MLPVILSQVVRVPVLVEPALAAFLPAGRLEPHHPPPPAAARLATGEREKGYKPTVLCV